MLKLAPQQPAGIVGHPAQPLLHGVVEFVAALSILGVLFGQLGVVLCPVGG